MTTQVGLRGMQAYGVYRGLEGAYQKYEAGDYLGALLDAAEAGVGAYKLSRSCFTGDTPIEAAAGALRADAVRAGDLLFARDEHDPEGPVTLKRVEEVFVRVAAVLNLHVRCGDNRRVIRTTQEHPFYVLFRGWVTTAQLRAGDVLLSRDGREVDVEADTDGGEVTTVYNFRVADYHTYFAGSVEAWGFSVWAHNSSYPLGKVAQVAELQKNKWSRGVGQYLTHAEAVEHVRGGGDVFAKTKDHAFLIAREATGHTPVMHTRVPPEQRPHYHPATEAGDPLPPHVMW